ncbi:hydroxylase [Actinoplanes italicus]|uniref:Salicylate hydroxylase n=1 Tax=Actinoplanes italicus TaxID=113567 RepID=A0A2T0JY59_9ACTN|nr:FAD-dependent monooxygenase [Actinoplanes italicus]PRX13816.1 salicylate hydroxylase [Actinoplanes italicus]GIE36861.1 hydroxylase [Actinoplanes italicus]
MRRIAIVGAGIGGLTAAIALTRRDAECVVVEQRPALGDEGTGIQISPNAAAELLDLGVRLDFAVPVAQRELRRWQDDRVLGRTDLGRYDVPYLTMPRGALIGALREAAGGSRIVLGRRCVAVRDDRTSAVLGFDDGTAGRFDAVIGADGLRSVVRGLTCSATPAHSGLAAGRAVLPRAAAGRFVDTDRVVVWLGPGRHCVTYPISHDHVNLVVVAPSARFDGWHPSVRGLIALAGRMRPRPLYDMPPLPVWHHGRVVLLGDAAHPILPFIAQGAAQAIEDAVTLADRLDFAGFQASRQERVRQVFAMSRAGLRVHHLPDGPEQRIRDRALAAARPDAHDWLYGHRIAAASRRRSDDTSSTRDARPSF